MECAACWPRVTFAKRLLVHSKASSTLLYAHLISLRASVECDPARRRRENDFACDETWNRIATFMCCVSPWRALGQGDEISSSFHSHSLSSIIWGGEFLATKRFKVLVSCWIRTWVRSWNADHFFTWTGEYAKRIWHRSNGEYLIAPIVTV